MLLGMRGSQDDKSFGVFFFKVDPRRVWGVRGLLCEQISGPAGLTAWRRGQAAQNFPPNPKKQPRNLPGPPSLPRPPKASQGLAGPRAREAALKTAPLDRMPEPSCAALIGQARGSDPDEKQRLFPGYPWHVERSTSGERHFSCTTPDNWRRSSRKANGPIILPVFSLVWNWSQLRWVDSDETVTYAEL